MNLTNKSINIIFHAMQIRKLIWILLSVAAIFKMASTASMIKIMMARYTFSFRLPLALSVPNVMLLSQSAQFFSQAAPLTHAILAWVISVGEIAMLSKVPEERHQMTLSCSPPLGVSGLECVHHSVYQGRALEVTVKSSDLLKSSIKNTSLPLFLFLTFPPKSLHTHSSSISDLFSSSSQCSLFLCNL